MMRSTLLIFVLLTAFVCTASAKADGEKKVIKICTHSGSSFGLVFTNPDNEILESLNLDGGALVLEVKDGSEAEKAGLKKNDVVTSFNGKTIDNAKELNDLAEDIETEKTVEISVSRDREIHKIQAEFRPADNDEDEEVVEIDTDVLIDVDEKLKGIENFRFFIDDEPHKAHSDKGGFLGVEVKNMSDQLKEFFKVEYGVLVEKVLEKTPAEKAGLKAGDVIMKINDKKIEDYSDLVRRLNYYDPKDEVTIEFSRKEKIKKIDVVLAEKSGRKYEFKKYKGRKPGSMKKYKKFNFPDLMENFPKNGRIEIYSI